VRALLLDIGPVSCGCTNHALELFSKAMSGEDGADDGIWKPHDSPFVRHLIELFTTKGLTMLSDVQAELNAWIEGQRQQPSAGPVEKPQPALYAQWTPAEMDLVELYLSSLSRAQFGLEEWGLLIDYLVQRYLPLTDLQKQATALAVRAALMGKAQTIVQTIPEAAAARVLEAMPQSYAEARDLFGGQKLFDSVMEYGSLRACENVQQLSDATRHRMKATVLEAVSRQQQGDAYAMSKLQQTLLDDFATLNRDWRRIAVTEAGECANQGFIASLPLGSKVKRIEIYHGACSFCRKINGRVMTVVAANDPNKNGETDVWPGKTNIGRSSARRKRVGDELIERTPEELWWVPAGTVHPHCRGIWHVLRKIQTAGDAKFTAWLAAHLADDEVKKIPVG
jgi:hypothetical protein